MVLYRSEVPVAFSMVELAEATKGQHFEPFQQYMCYWVAFNSIYATLKYMDHVQRHATPGAVFPAIRNLPREQEQILAAFHKFSDELKHRLVLHPNTEFFVRREPVWRTPASQGALSSNGVVNVAKSLYHGEPVVSTIDTAKYEEYRKGNCAGGIRDTLAKEILWVLYTVRCNLFHGGKEPNNENDVEVVSKALPLLQIIVSDFFPPLDNPVRIIRS